MIGKKGRLGRGIGTVVGGARESKEWKSAGERAAEGGGPADVGAEGTEGRRDEGTKGEEKKGRRSGGAAVRVPRGKGRMEARMVAIGALRPNRFQPRSEIDAASVSVLARSIRGSGLIQPIVAREAEGGLEIIAGERRWRAAREAGLTELPVLVREANDEEMLELALVENIHREDLNAVERARAYRQYCDTFGLTVEAVAERVGEDRTTVTNYVRLLELPEAVLGLLSAGRISAGHARCILGIPGEFRQVELALEAAGSELSVRALENIVRNEKRPGVPRVSKSGGGSGGLPAGYVRELEERFERVLETKVKIHSGRSKGSGRIVIEFYAVGDFDRICERLGVKVKEEE